MTRAAQPKRGFGKRIKDSKDTEGNLYSLIRRLDNPTGISAASTGSGSGGAGTTGGNFLPTAGGTMIGPIAFFPKVVTIATGAIDIGEDTDEYSSRIIVTPESGATDDLVTITGAQHAGQLLILQGIETNTITIKTTGNIETINGQDITLDNDDNVIFIFDSTDNKWQQVTLGNILGNVNAWTGTNSFSGSVFTVTSPNIILGDDITDDIAITGRISTDVFPITDNTDSLGDATHRWANIYGGIIIGGGVTATTTLTASGDTILGDAITDTISTLARLDTDFLPETDNLVDLGSATNRFANIYGGIGIFGSVTASTSLTSSGATFIGDADSDVLTITGEIKINDMVDPAAPAAGIATIFLDSADDELKIIHSDSSVVSLEGAGGGSLPHDDDVTHIQGNLDNTKTLRFDVSSQSTSVASVLASAATAGRTWTLPNITGELLSTQGTQTISGSKLFSGTPTFADGLRVTFNPNGVNAGINVGSHTAAPSTPTDGDIYYNSTDSKLYGRVNSAWVDLGQSGGAATGEDFTDRIQCVMEVPNDAVAYPNVHNLDTTASAKITGIVLPYGGGIASELNFKVDVPDQLAASPDATITVRFMSMGTGTTDSVRITVSALYVNNSESFDQALSAETEVTVAVPDTIENRFTLDEHLTTQPVAGDTIIGTIKRDSADVLDDYLSDIMVIGIYLEIDRTAV